jgi:MFS family permease
MSISKILLSIFIFSLGCTLGQTTLLAYKPVSGLAYNAVYEPIPPREKVKPREKKKKKLFKRKFWKQDKGQTTQGLKNSALTAWLIFTIAMTLLVIALSFVIGLGLLQWVIAAWVMLGAELAAFGTIMSILWGDRPGGTAYVNFVFLLFGLIAVNVLIGLAFVIWGLAILWPFGWIIGLVLIFLAALFFLIHWLVSNADSKKG